MTERKVTDRSVAAVPMAKDAKERILTTALALFSQNGYIHADREGMTMVFEGIGRSFSTVNDRQYQTIGAFWDELSARYGLENLQGLGYGWTEDSIEYVIGLKDGRIDGADRTVELPDNGWVLVRGRTDFLGQIYEEIYQGGRLKYEIERFTDSGDCEILYFR